MTDISFADDKRAAVRHMLENWPQGGIVCLTPRQMLAILDAYEKALAANLCHVPIQRLMGSCICKNCGETVTDALCGDCR